MRRKGSDCTRISPAEITPRISLASRSGRTASPNRERPRQRQVRGACGSRLLRTARWAAARFYRRARVGIARAFRPSSTTTKRAQAGAAAAAAASPDCTPARRSSRRQQSAPTVVVVVDDSHKSEAVEECIRFMNSSSRKYR